jgi:hypothetical protein
MKARCYNPSDPRYPGCGGRGIKMHRSWRDTFAAFLHDLGSAPPDTILKRFDLDGDFEPGNCGWEPKPARKIKRAKSRMKLNFRRR